MHLSPKFITLSLLVAAIILGVAATRPPKDKPERKNVRVLPKNINEFEFDALMERYSRQLGVPCIYCHVEYVGKDSLKRIDYVSDEKPEKRISRNMMRMTLYINRKYYKASSDREAIIKPQVGCGTCHRGLPRPD